MNFQKKIVAAAIASAMVSSAAVASTVGSTGAPGSGAVGNYANGLTIAAEAVRDNNYTLDLDPAAVSPLGNAVGAWVRFVPSFGLNSGDIITLTFTNARYMDGDVKLVGEEAITQQGVVGAAIDINNDGDTNDVVEVGSNFGAVDVVNGVASVSMRINNGLILPTGIELVLQATGANLEDGATDGVLDDATDNPTLRIPAGTSSGATISVASTGVTSGNIVIPAAANSNNGGIADLLTQIDFGISTEGTSTIDVAAANGPRTQFVAEGAGNIITGTDDTSLTQSAAVYTVSNGSGANAVEDFIALDAEDAVVVSVVSSSNLDGVTAVTMEADAAGTATTDDTDRAGVLGAGPSTTTYNITLDGTMLPANGAAMSDDIWITVNGTTTLLDRTFDTSAVLTYDADFAVLSGSVFNYGPDQSHDWDTNGTVLEATYTNTNMGFNNRFVISNSSGTAAPYTVTCLVENGNTCTVGAGGAGTIGANETLVLNTQTDDVVTVTGTGNLNRATVIFTIEAPTNSIQGVTTVVKPATGIEASHPMVRPGTN